MRALFDYDPTEDNLIPCKEIGVSFKHGDILQVCLYSQKVIFLVFIMYNLWLINILHFILN